jgi:hypothetical protein
MEPKIPKMAWNAWIDSYGSNLDDFYPGIYKDLAKISSQGQLEDNYDDEPQPIIEDNSNGQPLLFLQTQMGPLPLVEETMPSKIFNLWECNTNFNITPQIMKIVDKVEGVETLNVMSRYRFRVGVGKLFRVGTVVSSINSAISGLFNKNADKKSDQV